MKNKQKEKKRKNGDPDESFEEVKKRSKASMKFIKETQKALNITNKLVEDEDIDDEENEEEEYNPYEWRNFRHYECAKILMDNFIYFPVPISDSGIILFKNEKVDFVVYFSKLLPYLNLFIAGRLVLYEIAIVGGQNVPTLQILPLLLLEICVTLSVLRGHFKHKCFHPWGFFRYMCQQVTIVLLLTQALLGTFSWGIRIYDDEEEAGKYLRTEKVTDDGGLMDSLVIVLIVSTVVVEVFEIFRNWCMDLREAWIKGGLEGRTGIWRIIGSNEGDTVFLENLLG